MTGGAEVVLDNKPTQLAENDTVWPRIDVYRVVELDAAETTDEDDVVYIGGRDVEMFHGWPLDYYYKSVTFYDARLADIWIVGLQGQRVSWGVTDSAAV